MPDRLPSGFIGNREIGASETSPITSDKLQHIHKHNTNFGFAVGGTPTTREEILFVAEKAGKIIEVGAGLEDSGTNTAIAFDLVLRPSTSLLSSTISVVHGTGDRTEVAGTISGTGAYSAGAVVTAKMTVTSSTGAQGPWMRVVRQDEGD